MERVIIYTDGGSRGNPGLGAWAWWVMNTNSYDTDAKPITTNNEMELTAIKEALIHFIALGGSSNEVEIRSDSNYAINSVQTWCLNWIADGTIETRPNGALIKEIRMMIDKINAEGGNVIFTKVKGHSGEPGNEKVDSILNQTMDRITESATLVNDSEDPLIGLNIQGALNLSKQTSTIDAESARFEDGKIILSRTLESGDVIEMRFDLNGLKLTR